MGYTLTARLPLIFLLLIGISYAATLNISFVSQVPSDITATNVFSNLTITYNVSNSTTFNKTSLLLFFKVNTSAQDNLIYINGTLWRGFHNETYTSQEGINYSFILENDDILPGSFNILQETMEETPHYGTKLVQSIGWVRQKIKNVSSTANYSFLEIMVYNMTAGSAPANIYACNSSYSTGDPTATNRCYLFCSIAAGQPYNHTHSEYSAHQVCPFMINSTGFLGTVRITNIMNFLVKGTGTVRWNITYIDGENEDGFARRSQDNGATWIDMNVIYDMHIHQFSGNESFWYYACGNLSSPDQATGYCSSVRQELIGAGGLPPTPVNIYAPTTGVYTNMIEINWTAAKSPNGYPITLYNVSLTYPNQTFIATIIGNWSGRLNFTWNSSGYSGNYTIKINACDSNGLCTPSYSDIFEANPALPSLTINSPQPISYNFTNILLNITSNGSSIWFSWNLSGNFTYTIPININFSLGNITLTAWANNTASQEVSASVIFNIPPPLPPTVILLAPPTETITSETNITFIYTLENYSEIRNTTLWTNITGIWTVSAVNLSAILSKNLSSFLLTNLSNGTYIWNVLACDYFINCTYAPKNFTLTIGIISCPVLSDDSFLLTFPIGLIIGLIIGIGAEIGKGTEQKAVISQ